MLRKHIKKLEEKEGLLKKKYDEFIENAFNIDEEEELDDNEKAKYLRNSYEEIVDANIEKNEMFLGRLAKLKELIQSESKKDLISKFIRIIALFKQENILSELEYVDFIDFKQTKNLAPLPTEILYEKTLLINENLRKSYFFSESKLPKFKIMTLEDFQISEDEMISKLIFTQIKSELETPKTLQNKRDAISLADELLKKINFKEFCSDCKVNLEFYGSAVNQFSFRTSDIDVTFEIEEKHNPRDFLKFFHDGMKKYRSQYNFKILPLLHDNIRVPIIDITFSSLDIKVSFSVNNKLGIINSRLLALYSQLDSRCKLLALLVKVWAKVHKISSAKNQYLTSYAYNLMVIYFLQTIQPPILPSLQALRVMDTSMKAKKLHIKCKDKDGELIDSFETRIDYEDNPEILKQIMRKNYSQNRLSVLELLKKFFEFIGSEDNYKGKTWSIRLGKELERNEKSSADLYSIEDPFDLNNYAGRHVKSNSKHAADILFVIDKSCDLLDLNAENIFQPF